MAHVQDLWEKTVDGRRVRTSRYGNGNRWQARYLVPEGQERTRTFARKQDAERFITTVRADVLRGAYIDLGAGKVAFAEFAQRWLAAQTFDESSREATELRLRRHASRHFGHRELRNIKPSVIQAWLRKLQQELAPSYVRTEFTNVSSVFNAAVDDGLITSTSAARYSIVLATHSDSGLVCWNPVKWGLDPAAGRSASERGIAPLPLFDERSSLRAALVARAGTSASFSELRTEAGRLGFLDRQLRATLGEVREDGAAIRESHSTHARPGPRTASCDSTSPAQPASRHSYPANQRTIVIPGHHPRATTADRCCHGTQTERAAS